MVIWWACATVPTAPAWPAAHRRVRKYLRDRSRGRRAVGRRGGSRLAGRCGSSRRGGHGDLPRLRALREGLRQVLEAHEAGSAPLDGWSSVGLAAAGVRLTLECSPQEDALRLFQILLGWVQPSGRSGCCIRCGPRRDVAAAEACRSETCRWGVLRLIEERNLQPGAAWRSAGIARKRVADAGRLPATRRRIERVRVDGLDVSRKRPSSASVK